jgi:hypothetical protein
MLADAFMQIARDLLEPAVFDEISQLAAHRVRQRATEDLTGSDRVRFGKRRIAEILSTPNDDDGTFIGDDRPHIVRRMEERFDMTLRGADLAELSALMEAGSPNVDVLRTRFDRVEVCAVRWRGQHFVVVWNRSRNHLITAYPRAKKRSVDRNHHGSPKKIEKHLHSIQQIMNTYDHEGELV